MAKGVAPLFSLSASGSIAKTLVYFSWKGIPCVRQHVVPANPNTAAQQGSRAKMTAAVDACHAAAFIAADLTAWRKFASISPKPMTWFNRFTKSHILAVNNGETWVTMSNDATTSTTPGEIDFSIDAVTGKSLSVRWGTSASYMPNSNALAETTGTYEYTATGQTEGARIYYQFYQDGGTYVESGIGQVDVDVT